MPGDQGYPVLTVHPSILDAPPAPCDPEVPVSPAMVCILVPWDETLTSLLLVVQCIHPR